MHIQIRKSLILWLIKIVPVALLLISCSIFEDNNEIVNYADPGNPYFRPPSAIFLTENNIVFDTSDVRILWEETHPAMSFSYRIDDSDWSDWSEEKCVQLMYLTEGKHTFQLHSMYSNEIQSTSPQILDFYIDDISGPALAFSKRIFTGRYQDDFNMDLRAIDLPSVKQIHVDIDYYRVHLNLDEFEILAQSEFLIGADYRTEINSQPDSGFVQVDIYFDQLSDSVNIGDLSRLYFSLVGTNNSQVNIMPSSYYIDQNDIKRQFDQLLYCYVSLFQFNGSCD